MNERQDAGAKALLAMPVAAVWGFAEAVFFFIVPDVFLTRLALSRWSTSLHGCAYATLGALLGGVLMYVAGRDYPEATVAALDYVPAVSSEMIVRTGDQLEHAGSSALFRGVLTATPYKIFAAQAGRLDHPLIPFLAVSATARFARFAVATFLTLALAQALRRVPLRESTLVRIHAGFWLIFYGAFFLLMPY